MIEDTLGRLAMGQNLSQAEIGETLDAVMDGRCTEGEIGLLLVGLRLKGETADEVAGAAAALRRHMRPIRTTRTGLIDTCGTGGSGSSLFNVSTSAAIVASAAGAPVAKHGNRAATSRSGSADVLQALCVNIEADVPTVERCLDRLGLCFCFARLFHPAMKHVAAVRTKLGMPTIFNLLGPLCNPAGAEFQLLGAGRPETRPLLAEALLRLGAHKALVVSGADGLGEVSLAGETFVTEVSGGQFQEYTWSPGDFGLETASLDSLRITSPAESAALIRRVLDGQAGPARDMVVLNAAAALWTAARATDLRDAARQAAVAIDSGAAKELLARLVLESNTP